MIVMDICGQIRIQMSNDEHCWKMMNEKQRSILERLDRRDFLKRNAMLMMAAALPGCSSGMVQPSQRQGKGTDPKTAAVCWYSQTGNTERAGQAISQVLEGRGLKVLKGDYRSLKQSEIGDCDLVIAGSPVFYYDVPSNFRHWLQQISGIQGKPAAAYVTFGGEGGNQHNAACELLGILRDKGAVPVGMDMFGAMSSFAITWSTGNAGRVLRYRHRPDQESYKAMRAFGERIYTRATQGITLEFAKGGGFREWIRSTPSIWSTKLLITRHQINPGTCIQCGICRDKCPVDAIDLDRHHVDTDRCIACLGCINNCPAHAVDMAFMGQPVTGYPEFIRQHNIVVMPPPEVSG